MKNLQKGFVVPLVILVITLLVIGGGVYVYNKKAGCSKSLPFAEYNYCLYTTAVKENNIEICNKTSTNGTKYTCISNYAKEKEDLNACNGLPEFDNQGCIMGIALKTKNLDLCKTLKGNDYQGSCQTQIQNKIFSESATNISKETSDYLRTGPGVKTSINISKNVIVGRQNENRLNWDRYELGNVKIGIRKSDVSQKYFWPSNFICVPNDDKPIYLIQEVNGKLIGAGGGYLNTTPAGEDREYIYKLILLASSQYIKDFSQYSNGIYKDYSRVDYSQKGFDIGKLVLPLSLAIYSTDKELQSIHCNNLGIDGISKIADISIVR